MIKNTLNILLPSNKTEGKNDGSTNSFDSVTSTIENALSLAGNLNDRLRDADMTKNIASESSDSLDMIETTHSLTDGVKTALEVAEGVQATLEIAEGVGTAIEVVGAASEFLI